MFYYIVLDTHTKIANRDLFSCRMDTKHRSRVVKAQTENKDQPQLAIVVELAE